MGLGVEEMGTWGQKVQSSSYKMQSWDVVYSMVTTDSNTMLHTESKRVDLKSSHHKKNSS